MVSKLRKYFLTGLLVWLPMGVTIWVLLWLYSVLDGIFDAGLSATNAVIPGLEKLAETLRHIPGLGVLVVALVLLVTGMFVANIFGQWWVRQWTS